MKKQRMLTIGILVLFLSLSLFSLSPYYKSIPRSYASSPYVQSTYCSSSSMVTTYSCSLSNTAIGDTVLVGVYAIGNSNACFDGTFTVTWTGSSDLVNSGTTCGVSYDSVKIYGETLTSSGTVSVSTSYSVSAWTSIFMVEFSGVQLNGDIVSSATSGTSVPSFNLQLVAFSVINAVSGGSCVVPTGWTEIGLPLSAYEIELTGTSTSTYTGCTSSYGIAAVTLQTNNPCLSACYTLTLSKDSLGTVPLNSSNYIDISYTENGLPQVLQAIDGVNTFTADLNTKVTIFGTSSESSNSKSWVLSNSFNGIQFTTPNTAGAISVTYYYYELLYWTVKFSPSTLPTTPTLNYKTAPNNAGSTDSPLSTTSNGGTIWELINDSPTLSPTTETGQINGINYKWTEPTLPTKINTTSLLPNPITYTQQILSQYNCQPFFNAYYYTNITLSDNYIQPVQSGTVISLTINPSTFSSFEASNLQNIAFYDINYNPINAWVYSGTLTSSSTSLTIYLKLTIGFSLNNNETIYLAFFNKNVSTVSQCMGYAPTYSAPYGSQDNGANVFPFYDNFAGTSLNTGIWTPYTYGSSSVIVNNGVLFQTDGANGTFIISNNAINTGSYGLITNIPYPYAPADGTPPTGLNGFTNNNNINDASLWNSYTVWYQQQGNGYDYSGMNYITGLTSSGLTVSNVASGTGISCTNCYYGNSVFNWNNTKLVYYSISVPEILYNTPKWPLPSSVYIILGTATGTYMNAVSSACGNTSMYCTGNQEIFAYQRWNTYGTNPTITINTNPIKVTPPPPVNNSKQVQVLVTIITDAFMFTVPSMVIIFVFLYLGAKGFNLKGDSLILIFILGIGVLTALSTVVLNTFVPLYVGVITIVVMLGGFAYSKRR